MAGAASRAAASLDCKRIFWGSGGAIPHHFRAIAARGFQRRERLDRGRRWRQWIEGILGVRWRGFPGNDFTVDHRAVGQAVDQAVEFGKAFGDQLFTAGPDPQSAVALDHLGTDTIPLPFHLPVAGRAEQPVELFDRLG